MLEKIKKLVRVGENKISFCQTSKGVWYCNDFSLYCKDLFDGIQISSGVITAIDEMLKEFNKGE